MVDRRVVVFGAIGLLAMVAGALAVETERIMLTGSTGNVFSPADGVFLQTAEGESDAVFAEELATAAAGDAESQSDYEAEFAEEEDEEGDAESDEDEFELDVEADEEADAQLDASAQLTLQHYAELQGATDTDADADAEADAEAEVSVAMDALSGESALSEAETEMEAEFGAEMDAEAESDKSAGSASAKGKSKKGKGKGKGKKKPSPGMKMSQLNLRDDSGEGAKINLAQGKGRYSMGVNPAGVFSIDMEGRTVLSVSGKSGMVRARGDVTVWNTLSAGSLTLNQVPQWKMVRSDSFEKFGTLPKRPIADYSTDRRGLGKAAAAKAKANANAAKSASPQVTAADVAVAPKPPVPGTVPGAPSPSAAGASPAASNSAAGGLTAAAKALAKKARGWLYDDVIRCNGMAMLSAKPGRTVSTRYKKLPRHTQVRITATVHFIDDWQGETGWLKLNDQFVWTESVDQKGVTGKFSVCGSPQYPESRFSAPIDVVWNHKAKHLTLSLGSNLDDGSDARFAVSNVAVYTRDTTRKLKKRKNKTKKVKIPKCKDPKDAACAKRRADAIAKAKADAPAAKAKPTTSAPNAAVAPPPASR